MGNNRSRIGPMRPLPKIDSLNRARYKNQRELIQLRRKINNINIKHMDEMSRLNFNRYEVKIKLHELQHEKGKRQLLKKMNALNQHTGTLSNNESRLFDENDVSALECPSLLLHDLNSSNEWEKSIIMPSNQSDIPSEIKPFKSFETIRPLYPSKFESSYNSFEQQTESFLLNDSLSLKHHTEQMKKAIQTAVAKSKRDTKVINRRDAHNY